MEKITQANNQMQRRVNFSAGAVLNGTGANERAYLYDERERAEKAWRSRYMAGLMTFEEYTTEFPGYLPDAFDDAGNTKTRKAYEKCRGSAQAPHQPCGWAAQFWVVCRGNVEGRVLSFADIGRPELMHYSEAQFDSELLGDVFELVRELLDGKPAIINVEIGRGRGKNHIHVLCEPGVLTVGRRDRRIFTPARFISTIRYFLKPVPFTEANAEAYRSVRGIQERVGRRLRPANLGSERVSLRQAQSALGVNLLSPKCQRIDRDTQQHCEEIKKLTGARFVWSTPIDLKAINKPEPRPRPKMLRSMEITGGVGGLQVIKVGYRDNQGVWKQRRIVRDHLLKLWLARAVEARKAAQAAIEAFGEDRVKPWEVKEDEGVKDVRPCRDEQRPRVNGPPQYRHAGIAPPPQA